MEIEIKLRLKIDLTLSIYISASFFRKLLRKKNKKRKYNKPVFSQDLKLKYLKNLCRKNGINYVIFNIPMAKCLYQISQGVFLIKVD